MYDSQSKSIGDLLSNNQRAKIVVPRFQRGYSWEKKHVTAFWRDLKTFKIESSKKDGPEKYFLGPIVTLEESKETTNLLDGQQRLATATILFSVIRDTARKLGTQASSDFARDTQREMIEKTVSGYALQLGEMDKLYFEETVQKDPPAKKTAKLRSHKNIAASQKLLTETVEAEISTMDPVNSLNYLRELSQAMRSDLVMASIPVKSERDAFKIFETLNDRGLRLSVPDLLLNYLMGSAQSDDDRGQVRGFWNEMLEQMGRRDINRFLRHLWVSRFGDLKSQDLFSALKIHIEDKSTSSLAFARECAEECEAYASLLDQNEKQLETAAPLVRALVRQLDIQAALPLLLSTYRGLPTADFEKVVRWVLVFITRYSIISHLDSGGAEKVLFDLAAQARKMVADAVAKRPVVNGETNKMTSEEAKECLNYVKDVLKREAPTDERVKSAAEDRMLANDEAKYILSRIAAFMQTGTKEVKIDEANLEHIFPQSPKEADWGGKEKIAELEPYTWHLGNLTILGTRLNREAGNKPFATKREHYAKKSELIMAQQVAEKYTTWDVAEIQDRAKKYLAPQIAKIWNFDNPSRV